MADQGISVFLQLKDQMSAGLSRVGSAMGDLGKSATSLGSSFAGMQAGGVFAFEKIVGKVGEAVEAVRQFNSAGIDLNTQFEATSTRIAGTLRAFNVAPTFAKAQAEAAGVMNVINDLAARLPGETEDYISVFATALPKVIAAGMRDVGEAAKFTSMYTAVAATNMVDAGQAGMDLFRMLAGQAGADVRMWTTLSEHIGITTEAFNKLSAPERLAAIQAAIGKSEEALSASGGDMGAVAGGVKSQLQEINKLATEMSFKRQKDQLAEMSRFLRENRQDLIAGGEILTNTYQTIANTMERSYEGFKLIGAKSLDQAAKMIFGYDAGKVIREREEAAREAAANKPSGPSEYDLAAQRIKDRLEEFQSEKFGAVLDLLPAKMKSRMEAFGPSGWLTEDVYEKLISIGQSKAKAKKADDRLMAGKIDKYLSFMAPEREELTSARIFGTEEARLAKEKAAAAAKKKHVKAKGHVTNFYNSRFDIKQDFAEGFDPDRIAVAFSQDLARLGEMKVMSGYAPLFTGR